MEIERRFATVLHHTTKRIMESVNVHLLQCLDGHEKAHLPAGAASAVSLTVSEAAPIEQVIAELSQHLEFLAPALDPRVLRRGAKELWNSCAGVSAAKTLLSQQHLSADLPGH